MDTIIGLPLPPSVLGRVQVHVVHGEPGTIPDIVAHAHVLEPPVGDACPYARQCVSAGHDGFHEPVGHVPIAEIATKGHVEDPAVGDRSIIVRGADIIGAYPCATTAGVGP